MTLGRPNQGRREVQVRGTRENQGESVKCFGRQTWTDYKHGRWMCKREDIKMDFNPSAWSDEPCSSCCTLSLIRLYLDKL